MKEARQRKPGFTQRLVNYSDAELLPLSSSELSSTEELPRSLFSRSLTFARSTTNSALANWYCIFNFFLFDELACFFALFPALLTFWTFFLGFSNEAPSSFLAFAICTIKRTTPAHDNPTGHEQT